MRGRTGGRGPALVVFALAGALLATASCAYAPNFADHTLVCGGDSACPKGYVCGSDNTCLKDTGADPSLANFVGTWDFSSGLLNGTCTDGFVVNTALDSTDFIQITTGGAGLKLQYYCDSGWSMTLPAGSTTASARVGDTCHFERTDSGILTKLDWAIVSLTFSTSDGLDGVVSGHIAGPFTDNTPSSGTCDLSFDGNLMRE